MAPQRLDVDHLEAGGGHLLQRERDVRQLAIGKHVAVDERAGAAADHRARHVARGDAVVQDESVFLHQGAQLLEVRGKLLQSHVLEHAHARDLVEGLAFRQVAVVAQLYRAAVFQPFRPDQFAHVLDTGSRKE